MHLFNFAGAKATKYVEGKVYEEIKAINEEVKAAEDVEGKKAYEEVEAINEEVKAKVNELIDLTKAGLCSCICSCVE